MIRTVTCYSITCDICATEYNVTGLDESPLHFESVEQALQAVTDDGWTADAGRVLCLSCVHGRNRSRCFYEGHIWGDWTPCHCRGHIPEHARFGCDLYQNCLRPGCDACQASTLAALPTIDDPPGPGR